MSGRDWRIIGVVFAPVVFALAIGGACDRPARADGPRPLPTLVVGESVDVGWSTELTVVQDSRRGVVCYVTTSISGGRGGVSCLRETAP